MWQPWRVKFLFWELVRTFLRDLGNGLRDWGNNGWWEEQNQKLNAEFAENVAENAEKN